MSRRKPVKHTVKSHTRGGKSVREYERGEGYVRTLPHVVVTTEDVVAETVVLTDDMMGHEMFAKLAKVGGEVIGQAEPKYVDDMVELVKEMRKVEDEFNFYDFGAGGDEYYIIGAPKSVRVIIKGDNVEMVSSSEIMKENYIEEWQVTPRSEWPF